MATSFQPGAAGGTRSQKAPGVEPAEGAPPRFPHRKSCSERFQREAVKDAFPRGVARGPLLQWQIDPRSGVKTAYELYADGHRVKISASERDAAAWFKRRWEGFNES
jgi:hypothetical protein